MNLILDKEFLISKIFDLNEKTISNSYINYTITENDYVINIFFDINTFDLKGWKTKDIFQNLNITFISSIKKNNKVPKDLFKIPLKN